MQVMWRDIISNAIILPVMLIASSNIFTRSLRSNILAKYINAIKYIMCFAIKRKSIRNI